MTTDEQWADALRAYSHAAYPDGAGPDPSVVLRAGRRRRRARRVTGTATACVAALALAFGVPAVVDATRHREAPPVTTPTTSATTAPAPTPAPSPTSPYPGRVTTLPGDGRLPDPVAAGVLGEPVRLDPTAGYVPGLGDGSAVAVIDTPLVPAGGEENGPTSVSGIGVRSSDGSIDWVVAPPSTPTVGPTTTWATVSEDWVVWLQTATSEPYDMAETLWAVPRSGGTPREIDRSVAAAVATVHGVQAYEPVVRGGWVLWYDEPADAADAPLDTPVSGTPVVMAAPLDGSGPARVLVPDATGMFADLCSDDPHAFYAGEGATSGPPSLHRIVLADDGSIASDEVVRADLTGAAEDTWDAGACGDTVAVAHDVDRENADRGAWVEVDHGGDVQSFVFPEGTGSSVADLTVGPRLVTWAMDNGGDEGARYLLDLADGTLYALPTTPGFAHVAANSLIVQWRENPTQEDADARDVLAPILAP